MVFKLEVSRVSTYFGLLLPKRGAGEEVSQQ